MLLHTSSSTFLGHTKEREEQGKMKKNEMGDGLREGRNKEGRRGMRKRER